MHGEVGDERHPIPHSERPAVGGILRALAEQFRIVMGTAETVHELCSRLERLHSDPPSAADVEHLLPLLPFVATRSAPLVSPLFDLIERIAARYPHPWPLLKGMLAARDEELVGRALELTRRRADDGAVPIDREAVRFLAQLAERSSSAVTAPDALPVVRAIVRHLGSREDANRRDPVPSLLVEEADTSIRHLAACLLDASGDPAPITVAERILGQDEAAFLRPYLAYTRATHRDLLSLVLLPHAAPPALPSLRLAHALLGEVLLRKIIAEVGWPRLNLGIEIRPFVRVVAGESFPLLLHPAEAKLAQQCGALRRVDEIFVITTHGGTAAERTNAEASHDPASRFREYNLIHARVLDDFLAVAPLSRERVLDLLERMDRIVGDFISLFSSLSEECSILPGIYGAMKDDILHHLDAQTSESRLSLEVTRLVTMFEDPPALGQVQTLHGLKRYLHQKGLQLGLRLVERSLATNRTVDVLIASQERILRRYDGIRYADFEPEGDAASSPSPIPYPVAIVARGFARQAIIGQEALPRVEVFCYGSEVHYFLTFRNHPAFLRINYAPPLQGGMIDLQYYGISKYELSEHPDVSLDALRQFFRTLEFGIEVDNTRVHARYDKEQAVDLRSLCEKAEAIFRLAPYLLDIDWTIGGLRLDGEARKAVAAAWATFFDTWGVLPLTEILTQDRLGILESVGITPAGRQESLWSGTGAYRDRFGAWPADFLPRFIAAGEALDVEVSSVDPDVGRVAVGQLPLERSMLTPLRQAVARGELIEAPDGYARAPSSLFERQAAAERFAEILASGNATLASASAVAALIAPLERSIPFRTVGTIGKHDVQLAHVPLQGEDLGVWVLRTEQGAACLAFYTHGSALYRRRRSPEDPWESNAQFDAGRFLSLMRRANYPAPGPENRPEPCWEEARRIRETLARTPVMHPRVPLPGEKTIAGLRASPGRCVGRVVFGTKGRVPADLDARVLVTPALRPDDAAFLYRASGVVSTGGGILSHAGLLAAQFRKPAIIVDGHWEMDERGEQRLRYVTLQYDFAESIVHEYPTSSRTHVRERRHDLAEGDLVVLESGEDVLRVLGQDRDVIDFHEGIRQYTRSAVDLRRASSDRDLLRARGRRARARHQIEKVLLRMTDPALTCHAVSELLLGQRPAPGEMVDLLRLMLANPRIAPTARDHLRWIAESLYDRCVASHANATERIPGSESVYEILHLRLDTLRIHKSLAEVTRCLRESDVDLGEVDRPVPAEISTLAHLRLTQIREQTAERLTAQDARLSDGSRRHLLRTLERTDRLIDTGEEHRARLEAVRSELCRADDATRRGLSARDIVWPDDGGLELYPLVGLKAANLGEIGRLIGHSHVPQWFAVTDRAFREILESPIEAVLPPGWESPSGATSLLEAIRIILSNNRLDHAQQSSRIRSLWETATPPRRLVEHVLAAYRRIGDRDSRQDGDPVVALRSSSCEEDSEIATRAGEFDTFLFIRGEAALLDYLKRTWSGLWSERALHHRSILSVASSVAGGGVIVQRIVDSRVSGVMQTVNVAQNDFRQIVINVGLGLGQGIVSGTAAADHIVVSKEKDLETGPLRFHYETADKREAVVFDRRAGLGTVQCEAPYHQRLRPALEYAELCELVAVATRLERLYGYPLDIEFGIEGTRLWILQARPVPALMSELNETLELHPFTNVPGAHHHQWESRQ